MLKTEKKVEYLELIYDLIFVYVIGRNHSLLQAAEDGFIPGSLFLTYVLFTLTAGSVYFTAMAFLIVSVLFLSYEVLYNHIIDREKVTTGLTYMLIHVFLIFALNLLTTALEFMRDTRVSLLPKTVFLVTAFLLYYLCLFALIRGAGKKAYRRGRPVYRASGCSGGSGKDDAPDAGSSTTTLRE